jgi:hypothetical protein
LFYVPGSAKHSQYICSNIEITYHIVSLDEDHSYIFPYFALQGLQSTAQELVTVARTQHEQKGVTGAVGGVLRQVPPTVIQPVIIATEATSNILGGMRNQLLPDKKREDEDKWKQEEED